MLRRPAISTSASPLYRCRGLSFYAAFDHAADAKENKTGFATGQVLFNLQRVYGTTDNSSSIIPGGTSDSIGVLVSELLLLSGLSISHHI